MSGVTISAKDPMGFTWHCSYYGSTKRWAVHRIAPEPCNQCKEIGNFRSSFALIRSPLIPKSARNLLQQLLDDAQLIVGIREPLTKL